MANERNGLPSLDCPQGHRIFFVRENPGIAGQTTQRKKRSFDLLSGLVILFRIQKNTVNNPRPTRELRNKFTLSRKVLQSFLDLIDDRVKRIEYAV